MTTDVADNSPRSQTLGCECLRALRESNKKAADECGAALADCLRCPVEVEIASIDQLAYGDFLNKLPRASCYNLLRAAPADGPLLLDVELSILYPMIDRMLGGGCDDDPPPRRPLSEIELPLAARLVRLFLDRLSRAWNGAGDWEFEVTEVESNPRLLRALPSDESVVSIDFRLTVGQRRGMARLCVPYRTAARLSAGNCAAPPRDGTPGAQPPEGAARKDDSTIELRVTLAVAPIASAELATLRVGDIIATEVDAGSPALVSFPGGPKFLAKPAVCAGRNVVRIAGPIVESDEAA
ncbi:MAG: flagellar motor switch protein FliM [Pirellulales bacterium]|nr:flagellar motor switch protein FliM [Pirellulales bacterium]